MKKKVSFDFDLTLSKEHIQKYAKELTKRDDLEVWIVTRRYELIDDYTDHFMETYGIDPMSLEESHFDLFKVADECGIKRNNIHFCDMEDKWKYFNGKDFVWHLDDDRFEVNMINHYTDVIGITHLGSNTWRHKCQKLIK